MRLWQLERTHIIAMKKILAILMIFAVAICAKAQKDVTKFLGIPVDGTKSEMIQKLKNKGFRVSPLKNDVLTGEFNGIDVNIHIGTNGNKVCRIMVCDAKPINERSIQIRFNNLCRQFDKNPKYVSFDNELIPDDEDISYQMAVKSKRYEAIFYQQPIELADTTLMRERMLSIFLEKYTQEELDNPTEEIKENLKKITFDYLMDLYSKKPVWFMISETFGEYYITMFYDNEYNRANGEDL